MGLKKLGFGFMRLPLLDADDQSKIDFEQLNKMVDKFLDRGFTYFDTAYMYHNFTSEIALRESLVKRHKRDTYAVATKLPTMFLKKEEDLAKTSDKISGRYFDLNDSKDKIKRLVEIEKKYIDYSAELKGKFLNGDFDTTWNEFLKELDAAGIEEVIQLINGQIDK